ncbi:MAG: 2-C-methyl-D-erythritol 4-phosphate cytidylyltransferase [bacterium]
MNLTGLIAAAGRGQRFGGETPKQFVQIQSKPVLQYSIELFDRLDWLRKMIIVVPGEYSSRVMNLLSEVNSSTLIDVVGGGSTRFKSLLSGLEAVSVDNTDCVLIQDAARPGVTEDVCNDLIELLSSESSINGVIPAIKLDDTIKRINAASGVVETTLDRSTLRGSQTPQLFELDCLLDSIEAWDRDEDPTDEALLLERAGYEVGFVDGLERCRKLTYPEDLTVLESLIDPGDESGS